jgi:hypothetical protein
MKQLSPLTLTLLATILACIFSLNGIAQVGVNTSSPGDGAILDIESSTKGLLIPRVNILDLATIAPVVVAVTGEESLLVYNTNSSTGKGFYYWDTAKWVKLAQGASDDWTTTGNSGTTPAGNFIGTTDDVGFAFRTFNIERMRLTEEQYVDSNGVSWAYLGIGTQTPGEILDVLGDMDMGGDGDDWDGISETIKMRAQSEAWFIGVLNDVEDDSDFFIGKTDNADDAPFRLTSDDEYVSIGSDDDEPQDILHITQDQEATTTVRVDNTHSRGFTSIELWDGSSMMSFFQHDNDRDELEIGHGSSSGEIDFYLGATKIMNMDNTDVNILGDLNVVGNISKGGGTFKIDHPLDPENKYLYHSFVESPDMLNVYNGNITTDVSGIATIQLPAYFSALNKDFKYQISAIKSFSGVMVYEEIKGNSFIVKSELPNTTISWQVTGVRQDPYANKNRVIPEVEKEEFAKGKYLYPKAYNMPKEKGIFAKQNKD